MKITDLNYLKNNGKHIDIIKYRNNAIWKRVKKEFGENPGIILEYTASDNTTEPYELLHGSSNYTTTVTGDGPYTYTIVTDDINDLPTRISFKDCANLLTVDYICDTSQITDMSSMFENCASLDFELSGGLRLNIRNVTNMRSMFSGCTALKSIMSFSGDAKLTDTSYMFYGCKNLTSLGVSRFNTIDAVNMEYMFAGCTSLTDLRLYDFRTDNAVSTTNMFLNCDALNYVKFYLAKSSSTIVDVANLLVSHDGANYDEYVIDMINCDDEVKWDVQSSLGFGRYRGWTIDYYEPVEPDPDPEPEEPVEPEDPVEPGVILEYTAIYEHTEPYLSHGDSNYTTDITYLGDGVYSYTISTDDITDLPTRISFKDCANLLTVDYICDTSQITDMSSMFYNCTALTSLDVSSFDTSNVTNMSYMFYGCTALLSLYLSDWDATNVTNMDYMFSGCTSLLSILVYNCNKTTISKIISKLPGNPSGTPTHRIYCEEANVSGLTPPVGWEFYY